MAQHRVGFRFVQPNLRLRDGVLSVAFSPAGQTLASGSDDDTIRLWIAPLEDKGSPAAPRTHSQEKIRPSEKSVFSPASPQSVSTDFTYQP